MSQEKIAQITIHTESMIKGFFGEYRWLSNYHVCEVEYDGRLFTSSEAAYHSAKNEDSYIKEQLQKLSPLESKQFGSKIRLRKDWESLKREVMYDCLKSKFTRNKDLSAKLLETGSKYLEETNYWDDTYWGVCNGKGKNMLGELLMKIRNEINLETKWI
jgi:ribA/ribD-fused uncharacterized protein